MSLVCSFPWYEQLSCLHFSEGVCPCPLGPFIFQGKLAQSSASGSGWPAASLGLPRPSFLLHRGCLTDTALKNPGSRSRLLIWQRIKRQQRGARLCFAFSIQRANLCPWGIISLSATAEEASGSLLSAKATTMPQQCLLALFGVCWDLVLLALRYSERTLHAVNHIITQALQAFST